MSDVTWGPAVSGTDSNGYKLTIQECTDWVNNDPKSCLTSPTLPKNTSGWSNCPIRVAPIPYPGSVGDSSLCVDTPKDQFICAFGRNCFAITQASPPDVSWGPVGTGVDAFSNTITVQECSDWVGGDPKSCQKSPTIPKNVVGWAVCPIGISPVPYPGLINDPSKCVETGVDNFTCKPDFNCFAITSVVTPDVKWGSPQSGCDGNGNYLTVQKCTDWPNNDVNECKSSKTRPKVLKWIGCDIGSTPGGVGGNLGICGVASKGPDDIYPACTYGRDCFAITAERTDITCLSTALKILIGIGILFVLALVILLVRLIVKIV